jgi:hypothetical protein
VNVHGRWVPDPLSPSGFRWQRHGEQPATTMLPTVPPATPDERDEREQPVGDVGDWIDPNAPDPTPEEITHPQHHDYVEPWRPV